MRLFLVSLLTVSITVFAGPDPARADFSIGVRSGKSFLNIGNRGISGRLVIGSHPRRYGPHGHGLKRGHRPGLGHLRPHRPGHRPGRPYRPVLYVPYDRIVYRDRPVERELPPTVPAAPPAPPPSTEPEVLDPAGPFRVYRARGLRSIYLEVGDTLPTGMPHVTLDPRRYGLDDPPEGELYARVRQQVVRITAVERRVTARIAR